MKPYLPIIIGLLLIINHASAQSTVDQTTLNEWNVSNTSINTGERIVAMLNAGTVGSATGAEISGQIIDGNSNWGYALPVVANFKVLINFTGASYLLQQDVATPDVTLELKSFSATQVALVANCTATNRQLRLLFRYTNGSGPTLTLGSNTTVTSSGTMLVAQPSYRTVLSGRVAINVSDTTKTRGYALAVGGSVIAESVSIKLQGIWPDYVFKNHYRLPELLDIKSYVNTYHHLPEMPSEKQIAVGGLNLGEMDKLLTKKVEELTLYLIDKDKQLQDQRDVITRQQAQIDAQTAANKQLFEQLRANQEQLKQENAELDQVRAKLEPKDN